MIVAPCFEADRDRGVVAPEQIDETVVVLARVENHQASPAAAAGFGNQHVVAMLRDIDGYKNDVRRRRLPLGHGRSLLFGLVPRNHLRDLLAGRGRLPVS